MLVSLSGTALKLFNISRLQAKIMIQSDVLDKLLYANDIAKYAKTEKTQRPNGPVNAHLIYWPTISTKTSFDKFDIVVNRSRSN